ncbi:hypothetical protein Tco_0099964 [Tanacetum coccineum]
MFAPWSVEGSSNSGDDVRAGMGKGDGDGAGTGKGGDSGSDGDGIGGSGGKGIWGSGEDHRESGDDGGVAIARSLATSESDQAGVGTGAGIEILAVIRYVGCGGGMVADSSVSNGLSHPVDESLFNSGKEQPQWSAGAGCSASSSSSSASMSTSSSPLSPLLA